MHGPQEDFTQKWRTTSSYSIEQMTSVYREIFFAGFPTPQDTASNGLIAFPEALVKKYFQQFGDVAAFYFDETKGIGCVTFSSGEDAEACYLCTHLTRFGANNTSTKLESGASRKGGEGGGGEGGGGFLGLLYLEFSQYLPFVNTLLLSASTGTSGMNRQLLRTFPVRERLRRSGSSGSIPPITGPEVVLLKGRLVSNPADVALPGGVSPEDTDVARAMVSLLATTCAPAVSNITVMDLWHGFFNQYVMKKTCPARCRIQHRLFLFASKPCAYQEIVEVYSRSFKEELEGGGAGGSSSALVRRLEADEDYHSTLTYLGIKLRIANDATMASFTRDVCQLVDKYKIKRGDATSTPGSSYADTLFSLNADVHLLESNDATEKLLVTSMLDLTHNVLANAAYIHSLNRRREPSGFRGVLALMDRCAASGSALSLAGICADPSEFADVGGIGHSAAMPVSSMLWHVVRTPLMLMSLVVAVLLAIVFSIK